MIEEAIKIGFAVGAAAVFFVIGFICTGIAIAVFMELIALPFRIAKKLIDRYESEKRTKSDPIFSRFKR